ncbi:MAG: non-heme iron oxygenase ferredoxin subunit [Candidatus Melainabacteria bacterium]|nr:non-heme iron oxygenase ferredoxin subunit [Candidatus Melainabacteria bacterium]
MLTVIKIKKSDVKEGQTKSFQLGNKKVVVCNVSGSYYAIEDICSHDNAELVETKGQLVDAYQIECPRHGARFDVRTGEAKKMPATSPIKTYNVKVLNNNELEIEIV